MFFGYRAHSARRYTIGQNVAAALLYVLGHVYTALTSVAKTIWRVVSSVVDVKESARACSDHSS